MAFLVYTCTLVILKKYFTFRQRRASGMHYTFIKDLLTLVFTWKHQN